MKPNVCNLTQTADDVYHVMFNSFAFKSKLSCQTYGISESWLAKSLVRSSHLIRASVYYRDLSEGPNYTSQHCQDHLVRMQGIQIL